MAATAISQTLASAVAARKKGVFTATVVWTLQASISDGLIDMVPDRVAFLFHGNTAAGRITLSGRASRDLSGSQLHDDG